MIIPNRQTSKKTRFLLCTYANYILSEFYTHLLLKHFKYKTRTRNDTHTNDLQNKVNFKTYCIYICIYIFMYRTNVQ